MSNFSILIEFMLNLAVNFINEALKNNIIKANELQIISASIDSAVSKLFKLSEKIDKLMKAQVN